MESVSQVTLPEPIVTIENIGGDSEYDPQQGSHCSAAEVKTEGLQTQEKPSKQTRPGVCSFCADIKSELGHSGEACSHVEYETLSEKEVKMEIQDEETREVRDGETAPRPASGIVAEPPTGPQTWRDTVTPPGVSDSGVETCAREGQGGKVVTAVKREAACPPPHNAKVPKTDKLPAVYIFAQPNDSTNMRALPHGCPHCSFNKFSTQESLDRHRVTCTATKVRVIYQCPSCTAGFDSFAVLETHMGQHALDQDDTEILDHHGDDTEMDSFLAGYDESEKHPGIRRRHWSGGYGVTSETASTHKKLTSLPPAVLSTDSCVWLKQEAEDQLADNCVRLKQGAEYESADNYVRLKQGAEDETADSCVRLKQGTEDESADSCVRLKQGTEDESADSCVRQKQGTEDESADSCVRLKQGTEDESADSWVRLKQGAVYENADNYVRPKQEAEDESAESCVRLKQGAEDESADSCVKLKQGTEDESADSCVRLKQGTEDESTDNCVRLKQEAEDQSADKCVCLKQEAADQSTVATYANSDSDSNAGINCRNNPAESKKQTDVEYSNLHPTLRGNQTDRTDVCQISGAEITRSGNVTSHISNHTGGKPEALKINMMKHTREKNHKCQQCSAAFSAPSDLKRHVLIHTGEKHHACQKCNAAFRHSCHLKEHMLIHTGEKPHKCQLCSAAFRKAFDLKSHVLIHTGEKPHKCQLCNAAFRQSRSLKQHMPIHTGEKPHKGQLCSAAFRIAGKLKIHMLIHTIEKHHACQQCSAAFRDCSTLRKHADSYRRKASQMPAV